MLTGHVAKKTRCSLPLFSRRALVMRLFAFVRRIRVGAVHTPPRSLPVVGAPAFAPSILYTAVPYSGLNFNLRFRADVLLVVGGVFVVT